MRYFIHSDKLGSLAMFTNQGRAISYIILFKIVRLFHGEVHHLTLTQEVHQYAEVL